MYAVAKDGPDKRVIEFFKKNSHDKGAFIFDDITNAEDCARKMMLQNGGKWTIYEIIPVAVTSVVVKGTMGRVYQQTSET